jgi:hypothetical protein
MMIGMMEETHEDSCREVEEGHLQVIWDCIAVNSPASNAASGSLHHPERVLVRGTQDTTQTLHVQHFAGNYLGHELKRRPDVFFHELQIGEMGRRGTCWTTLLFFFRS